MARSIEGGIPFGADSWRSIVDVFYSDRKLPSALRQVKRVSTTAQGIPFDNKGNKKIRIAESAEWLGWNLTSDVLTNPQFYSLLNGKTHLSNLELLLPPIPTSPALVHGTAEYQTRERVSGKMELYIRNLAKYQVLFLDNGLGSASGQDEQELATFLRRNLATSRSSNGQLVERLIYGAGLPHKLNPKEM